MTDLHKKKYTCFTKTNHFSVNALKAEARKEELASKFYLLLSLGVQLVDVEADPGRPVELAEGKQSNLVSFNLIAQPSPQSGGVQGYDLWDLNVFGSLSPVGDGERIQQVSQVLAPSQRNTPLIPPNSLNFGRVQHYFDMTGVECTDIKYLCAELVKSSRPNPDFDFEAIPDERVLVDCFNIHCMGIVIKETTLELYNGGRKLGPGTNDLSFRVQVVSDMDSGDAVGDMLWTLEAFLSSDYAGYGPKQILERQLLNFEQMGYDLYAGERIEFTNLATMLDRSDISCMEQMYLCVELVKGNSEINYRGARPDSLRDCQELACAETPPG